MRLTPIKANMTEISFGDPMNPDAVVLFSYNTPVACLQDSIYYRTAKKWSRTTTKHINYWLDGALAHEKPQEWFDELVK